MLIKLPYKLGIRNCLELLKDCFGIDDPKREKREVVQLEEIIIHTEPKREKERTKKRERKIRQSPKIKKIFRERLDIPVNKYLMVDASTNTDDVENEVLSPPSSLSSLQRDAHDYVFLE